MTAIHSVPDRPFATMPDAELADEIAHARIYSQSKDPKIKRKFAARLAELLGESGQREWVQGLPF